MKYGQILDVPCLIGSAADAAHWLNDLLDDTVDHHARAAVVLHMNCHNRHRLMAMPDLWWQVQNGGHLLLEGIALKLGIWLATGRWLPDANGTDLFPCLMDLRRHQSTRLFLFGGQPGIAEQAGARIQHLWPQAHLVGAMHGYRHPEEVAMVLDAVQQARPDVLLLGLGCPQQERLALAWAESARARVIWTVGGLFDFLAGSKPRAPLWMRAARLEWLFRLALEPRRLWARTFYEVPLFFLTAVQWRFSQLTLHRLLSRN